MRVSLRFQKALVLRARSCNKIRFYIELSRKGHLATAMFSAFLHMARALLHFRSYTNMRMLGMHGSHARLN